MSTSGMTTHILSDGEVTCVVLHSTEGSLDSASDSISANMFIPFPSGF